MKRNGLQRSKLSLVCFSLFMLLTCTQMVQAADDAEDSTNPAVEAKEAASAPKTEKKERMPSETVQVRPKNAGPDARFFRIEPDIVTNLNYQKKLKYVHARIELMTEGNKNFALIEYHEPMIRDKFILYFNSLKRNRFKSGKARAKLQAKMLRIAQKIMEEETGNPVVDGVYLSMVYIE